MLYLLIDNCSLRDLIDIHGYSRYLSELEELINAKKIAFVTHQLIIDEWTKHKSSFYKQKEKKLLPSNGGSVSTNTILPSTNFISTNHLTAQINQIDSFLQNATIKLKTPEIINNEFAERFRNKLAPFHIKRNSQNDWEIIGSFCHYCEVNAINQAFFLSSNYTDFGNENTGYNEIHSDLRDRFPSSNIQYYKDFAFLFEELKNHSGIPLSIVPYKIIPNKRYTYKTTIKKNVLDSIVYIYEKLYQEIDFIPLHILINYYPFSDSESSSAHYNHFTISYVSENLLDFFENILIDNSKKIHFKDETLMRSLNISEERIQLALKKLTGNLVFHLQSKNTRKRIPCHYYNPTICLCSRCYYNRFAFHDAFRELQIENADYKTRLKLAYIHYQLGNYALANDIYEEIVNTALNDKMCITYFIAKYNQKHLSTFLRNPFFNSKIDTKKIEYLSSIDPIEESVKLKSHTDYNLLSFIAQDDFFTSAFQNVRKATNRILEHYYSQLRGGVSFNQYIWDLIEEFTKLEYFINANYIIYDKFSNFENLFENVIEGLFASHAISDYQTEKFKVFDDYWVGKFLVYGNSKTIIRLFQRYDLQHLKYESTSKEGDSFLELFENLTESIKRQNQTIEMFIDEDKHSFESKLVKLLDNSLVMAAILDLSTTELNRFCKILVDLLNGYSINQHSSLKAFEYFIDYKGKLISKANKNSLLNFCQTNSGKCYQNLLYSILDVYHDNSLTNLSKEAFELILHESLGKCIKCERSHGFDAVGVLYKKVPTNKKIIIKNRVLEVLDKEFNFDLYYLALIYEIFSFESSKTLSLIENYKVKGTKKKQRSFFSHSNFNQDSYLDKIANLCFKYDIDTTTSCFKKFKKVDSYYEWLFDMNNFNYKKFDKDWILAYQTKYYFRAMSRSSKLIEELRKILKHRNHLSIERTLLRITNFASN